jgi:hypothetical protein
MEPRPALTEITNRAVIKTFYFTSLFVDKGIKEHYSPKMDIRAADRGYHYGCQSPNAV